MSDADALSVGGPERATIGNLPDRPASNLRDPPFGVWGHGDPGWLAAARGTEDRGLAPLGRQPPRSDGRTQIIEGIDPGGRAASIEEFRRGCRLVAAAGGVEEVGGAGSVEQQTDALAPHELGRHLQHAGLDVLRRVRGPQADPDRLRGRRSAVDLHERPAGAEVDQGGVGHEEPGPPPPANVRLGLGRPVSQVLAPVVVDRPFPRLEQGEEATTFRERLTDQELREERLFLQLRQAAGIGYSELTALCGKEGVEWIDRGKRDGWLESAGERVHFTVDGYLLSNEFISQLF